MNTPLFSYLGYIALVIMALYLVYVISVNVVGFLFKIAFYGLLLVGVLWLLLGKQKT